MLRSAKSRKPRPDSPADELGRNAAFPKPQFRQPAEPTDTRELKFRKIHPDRDEAYRRWLRFQDCAIKGKVDSLTDQPHVCWSPEYRSFRFLSDAAHGGKAYSGRLKRNDSGCFALCRHAHRQQESNMDEFDRRFGINRHEIAATLFARFTAEQERGK